MIHESSRKSNPHVKTIRKMQYWKTIHPLLRRILYIQEERFFKRDSSSKIVNKLSMCESGLAWRYFHPYNYIGAALPCGFTFFIFAPAHFGDLELTGTKNNASRRRARAICSSKFHCFQYSPKHCECIEYYQIAAKVVSYNTLHASRANII